MSESMAKRVRILQMDLRNERDARVIEQRRIRKLESALERLLWRVNKEGDGPLPDEALEAERVLRNG